MICSPLLSCSHCPSFVSTAWGMRFAKLSIGARIRTVVDAIFYRLANVQAPLTWLCAALFYLSEKSLNTLCHHRNLWQEPVIGTLKYLLPRNSSNRSQRRRRNSWLRPALRFSWSIHPECDACDQVATRQRIQSKTSSYTTCVGIPAWESWSASLRTGFVFKMGQSQYIHIYNIIHTYYIIYTT